MFVTIMKVKADRTPENGETAKKMDWHKACIRSQWRRTHMKKGLWMIAVIFLITAGYAAYPSSLVVGTIPSGGRTFDPAVQQYPGSPQQYPGNPQQYGQEDTSYFYNRLAPYGNWIYFNPYGYVWIPRQMGYRWRPYTDGHWVYTDYGWTWIANEEWGDITFHYGRWGWDNEIGWYWVPGTTWGPAWVSWRSNDQYMGWAPLQPGFEFSLGMNFRSSSMNIPINVWVFIQGPHFQDQDINSYVLPFERNQTIVNYSTMRNNMYTRDNRIINEGFGIDEVRRITGRNVSSYTLRSARQPGRTQIVGQEVQIFRPAIRLNNAAKPKVYLNTDQARRELAPVKVFDPRGQQNIDAEAAFALKRQNEEKRLLEISQTQEIKSMQIRRDQEAQTFRDAGEKARVTREYETKIADLKKNHTVEMQQLNVRHQNDVVTVKRVAQIKQVKQAPPDKKKKDNKD
jgi:hypothetical protein